MGGRAESMQHEQCICLVLVHSEGGLAGCERRLGVLDADVRVEATG